MTIDDKRMAIKAVCDTYEDCLDGCPLWGRASRCHAAATDKEIERNYKRIKEAEHANRQKTGK